MSDTPLATTELVSARLTAMLILGTMHEQRAARAAYREAARLRLGEALLTISRHAGEAFDALHLDDGDPDGQWVTAATHLDNAWTKFTDLVTEIVEHERTTPRW